MVILWVNIRVRPPPSWNSVFGTTWLRFSSRSRFRARVRNLVGPGPVYRSLKYLPNTGPLPASSIPSQQGSSFTSWETSFSNRQFKLLSSSNREMSIFLLLKWQLSQNVKSSRAVTHRKLGLTLLKSGYDFPHMLMIKSYLFPFYII